MRKKTIVSRTARASRWLLLAAVPIGLVVALGASSAAGAPGPQGAFPAASGKLKKVIVLLRDQPAPLAQTLRSHGATRVSTGAKLPVVVASVSAAQQQALAANPQVEAVVPDAVIPAPTPEIAPQPQSPFPLTLTPRPSAAVGPATCGTASSPEQDPEALGVIDAPASWALGYDGAGVKVAYIAEGIDPTIPDFKRNASYASAGSPAGSQVLTAVNFTGDPAPIPTGGEAILDASSIAAQGNTTYDLNNYVSPVHPLPSSPCDITVTGAAPGASVTGLDVFSNDYDTTTSNFIQAIDYAVANGVKVLNESFGANPFPDTALDALRIADDDAVAAGVTVVVSSGDSGVTSTIGSPATDPNLISVGASTTFRAYQQDTYGGINVTSPNATNGTWIDNNISSLSSAGFAQSGANTVDLVAPGDLNWTLDGAGGVDPSGGTSESAPLTSAAAADVIQAYASTHGGADPSPALVKQILTSTANDVDAPAEQQGAGLLDIGAAVKEATSIGASHGTSQGGLLISPNQINISQNPHESTSQKVVVTNTSNHRRIVRLSTRTLTREAASQSGSFCLNPSSSQSSCGPPTANTFQIWSGATEVYQEETFTVPRTWQGSRLNFSAENPSPNTGSSVLHVALYDPTGAYAGYSLPQGPTANYANIQVADPKPGTWTAVFFTFQNVGLTTGTSGTIQWQADTWTYGRAGSIWPSVLAIAPGATRTAWFRARSGGDPGDAAQSIVVQSQECGGRGRRLRCSSGSTNTIPVTVRTLVRIHHWGGSFSGVLTGGNGRGNPAQTNTYVFQVPSGLRDLDVSAAFSDVNDGVVAYLQNPEGNTVASSSNVTLDSSGNEIGTGTVNVYKDNPEPGYWSLVLDWLPPVSGSELSEPFSGTVEFNQVDASSSLPSGGTLQQGQPATFDVTVKNTAQSPEAFFLDPRTSGLATIPLADFFYNDQNPLALPLTGSPPTYVVPTNTSEVETSLTGSVPVSFDTGPYPGDPDLFAESQSQSGPYTASLDYTPSSGEVSPGLWYLFPSEIGPYGPSGAPPVTASVSFAAVTQGFDPTVSPSTGDLWSAANGLSDGFSPVYLEPGQSVTIPLTITPTADPGTTVSGSIKLDDVFQVDLGIGAGRLGGDELASLPYSYTVGGS